MRVISQDGAINVPYEGNMYCMIQDEENSEEYIVAVRNNSLTGYMPLATYNTKKKAQDAFNQLIEAGRKCIVPNRTFKFT